MDRNQRYEQNYKDIMSGTKAHLMKYTIQALFFFSAVISGIWFADTMPDLFLDPASFPTLAPLVSGIFGVLSMEAMVVAWDYQIKEGKSMTRAQVWAAWVGMIAAVAMSAATTFAAIMSYVGRSPDPVALNITGFATGNGIAYYIVFQLILGIIFFYVLGANAAAARHEAWVRSTQEDLRRDAERSVMKGRVAATRAVISDAPKVGRDLGMVDGEELLEAFRREGLPRVEAGQRANGTTRQRVTRPTRRNHPNQN